MAAALILSDDGSASEVTRAVDTTGLPTGVPWRHGPHRALLQIGQAFGSRYHIIALLGVGGMGEVYRAWDAELGIAVALKIIRPEVMADPLTAAMLESRFKNELLLSRKVTHKHVVRIHDLGAIDGIKYITMLFVEGRDLDTILQAQGTLTVPRALKLARHIAAGLEATHEAQVVHRDLKPANVMVDREDRAVIMDFGIARSTSAMTGSAFEGIEGTLAYMAPEQLSGAAPDVRADIYSFGLIAYEMLCGPRKADAGESLLAAAKARCANGVASVRAVKSEVPEPFAAVIDRCLQTDPAERHQSASDLVAALSRLDDEGELLPEPRRLTTRLVAMAAIIALAVAGGTYFLGQWAAPVAVEHEAMPVLIADFDNRTGEPQFNGVLEEALGVAMEGASFIHTFPRRDAQRLVRQIAQTDRLDLERSRVVAQREGVKIVLAGAIDRDGLRYRVSASSIDPIPGTVLTTASATAGSKDDVLRAVARVASELRAALGDSEPASARLSERETFTAASLDAATHYSQGQELLNNSRYEESIPYFRQAAELDPGFARAYSSWAVAAFSLGRRGEADALYKKTFALADRMTDREKFRTYGSYHLQLTRDYDQAIENYTRLLERYPSDRVAHGNIAVAHFYVLDFEKAMEHGRRAAELYPSAKLRNNLALYAMYASDFSVAADAAGEVLKQDPQYTRAYLPVAIAALDAGKPAEARTAYEKMITTSADGSSRGAMGLADLALYEGKYADAVAILRPAIAVDQQTGNREGGAAKQIALADAYHGLGRSADALAAIHQALDTSPHESVQLSAARLFVALNHDADARVIADALARKIDRFSRAYARIAAAELDLERGAVPEVVDALREAQKLADLWLVRFTLGRAYVEAGQYPQALAQFEACQARRGEASAIFQDDVPTFRHLAALPYWLGRAREGVGQAKQAAAEYQRFLALRERTAEPLVKDVRQRMAALTSRGPH